MSDDQLAEDAVGGVRGGPGKFLTSRRLPLYLAIVAIALTLPSLWGGWVADDHHHRARMADPSLFPGFSGYPTRLFDFADGSPERMKPLMDLGLWPWWTWPNLRAAFMRPVTVLTHWVDYKLWPTRPAFMHAQSIAWFAGLVVVVTLLYRRVFELGGHPVLALRARIGVAAGLAALLYTIDDARGIPAGWLANRNSLPAALFGFLAIHAHLRCRREGWRFGAVAGPVLLALSLLSKEAGIATCAYLFAFTLFLDARPWRQRFMSLVPYGVVVVVWRVLWSGLGYGVEGIGLYIDPLQEPLRYLVLLLERVPTLLLGQFFFPPPDVYMIADGLGVTHLYGLAAGAVVVGIGIVVVPRLSRDATTRFFALGMVLSLLPACTTAPMNRLLSFVGFGAFGLLSRFLVGVLDTRKPVLDVVASGKPRRWTRRLASSMVVIHVGLAPILLVVSAAMPIGPPRFLNTLQVDVEMDATVTRQTVVVVTAPVPLLAGFLSERRALDGLPWPLHTRVLAPHYPTPTTVSRTDAHTIVVRPANGYLAQPFCRIARSRQYDLAVGDRVELTGMTAEVLTLTRDGRPDQVSFRFTVPLEDPSLRWLRWADDRYQFTTFVPPAIGEAVSLR